MSAPKPISTAGVPRAWWGVVLALLTVQVAPAADTQTMAANGNRLRAIPREERLRLWEKLKTFDALSWKERSAIRVLDERIAQLPAADQANYLSVLKRYHQWVQGLTEAQRTDLSSVPPHERMRLVSTLRAEDRTIANSDTTPLFLKVIDLSAMTPFESAQRIKAWFGLSPEKRAEIEKISSRVEQQKRLAELGQQMKGGPANRLKPSDEDAILAKIESDPKLKHWMAFPLKKADPTKHEKVRRRLAVNYDFIEHPPAPVESSNLTRFVAALPACYRDQFDHLPPEEARRRLSILYRLVFSSPGEEMPVIRKAVAGPRAPAPPRSQPPASQPAASTKPF